jgi:hypothetical protein
VHLLGMKHYRVTQTGRTIAAEPRLREAPDLGRLTALVLHLADELHAEELRNQQIIAGGLDDAPVKSCRVTEGDADEPARTTA